MKEEYATMQEAAAYCDMPVRSVYRLARDMGLEVVKYGRRLIPAKKLSALKAGRRGRGNPDWIANSAAAAEAAIAAAKSRARKKRLAPKEAKR